MSRIVDLSHTITDGLVTYPGLPAPLICDYWSRDDHEFQIGKIEMVANTGTYIDTPFHRYADGDDLAHVDIARCADLDGLVFHAGAARVIGPELFAGREVRGRAVLVHTGWARHFGTDAYFTGHPYLTEDAAVALRDAGAALVGIDSLNIDGTDGDTRPVHTTLLGAGILIVEHLCNLGQLPDDGFRFSAAPPKIAGMGSFPVRAYARLLLP
ncbi:MAG: cyclase family protein [Gammaproteobacteria bacterium]